MNLCTHYLDSAVTRIGHIYSVCVCVCVCVCEHACVSVSSSLKLSFRHHNILLPKSLAGIPRNRTLHYAVTVITAKKEQYWTIT
jgi:hypothetical protein